MPFDSPEAEPALTRRSSRHRNAASATPVDAVSAAQPVNGQSAGDRPLSRRAARERINTGEIPAAVSAPVSTTPVTATEVRRRRSATPVDEQTAAERVADAVASVTEAVIAAALVEPVSTSPAVQPASATATDETPEAQSVPEARAEARTDDADAFEVAARAFRAASSSPVDEPIAVPLAAESSSEQSLPAEATTPVQAASRRRIGARRFFAAGASVGVMGIAGLLAVSMTLPAEAVAATQGAQVASASLVASSTGGADEASDGEIQAFVASSDLQNEAIERTEDFSTVSLVDLAAQQGINFSDTLYTNDPDAAIQWPFIVGVAMSSGYGMRNGTLHAGIDLVPGDGAPVQAIADGTVRIATESGGAYGVTVYIDHVIDGEVVTSHYSHMQYGSLRVSAGDTVKVGDIIGKVGNTGRSYGAHMHFEIIINGSTVDPLPWLQKNAGRYSY